MGMQIQHLQENLGFRQDWNKNKKSFLSNVKLAALDDGIEIVLISTPPEHRGTKAASKAMQFLINIADKHNTTLFLSPDALGGGKNGAMSQSKLEQWYARLGFEPIESNLYWARKPQ